MALYSRVRNQSLQWWHGVPLPAGQTDATPTFQPWHRFDSSINKWIPVDSTTSIPPTDPNATTSDNLVLVTWNVDATSPSPEARISALISHIQSLDPPPDILFLQEVSRPALATLLAMSWLRDHWLSSDADTTAWGTQSFTNMTLISSARFPDPETTPPPSLWRVKYPSRFARDALCCDIPHASSTGHSAPRIRLVNVHLDSLPINPSLRPRQLAIVARYLRAAGRGLVAGDFNPVLPADEGLVSANGLVDVWGELRPGEDGFTWGVDGEEPFPAGRLDRVAVLGLRACGIGVLVPGEVGSGCIKWSDHSGLVCSFKV